MKISILLCLPLILSLSACGGGSSSTNTNTVVPTTPINPGGTTVTIAGNSGWIAYQDGVDGNWTALIGATFDVADVNGKFGIAYKCQVRESGADIINIHHLTLSEYSSLARPFLAYCDIPVFPAAITATALNRTAVESALIGWGDLGAAGNVTAIIGTLDTTGIVDCYGGDIVGITGPPVAGVADAPPTLPSTFYIERNVPCGDRSIDFSGSNAFAAAPPAAITVNGSYLSLSTSFITKAKSGIFTNATNNVIYAGVPVSQQLATDGHIAGAINMVSSANEITAYLGYRRFKNPVNQTLNIMSAAAPAHTVSIAATSPYKRYTSTWSAYADPYYSQTTGYSAIYGSGGAVWHASFTNNWLGGVYSYTLPDFSSIVGWNNAWGISAAQTVTPVLNVYGLPPGASWAVNTKSGADYRNLYDDAFTDGEYGIVAHTLLTRQ